MLTSSSIICAVFSLYGLVKLYYVNTKDNIADGFTKPTTADQLQKVVQTCTSEGNTVWGGNMLYVVAFRVVHRWL